MKLAAGIALVGLLCAAAPAAHAQFDKTDPQSEIEIGRQVSREVEKQIPLSKNQAMIERVKRVGQSLADAMEHRAYPFEFKVIADPSFNAFCLPGGFMYVNEGLLTRITDDGALAYVMGHEMTHAAHRHYAKSMRKISAEWVVGILANVATNSNVGTQIVGLRSLDFSRSQEADADDGGLELAYNAGYEPESALIAIQEMIDPERKSPKVPDYLRDHPAGEDRYKAMQTLGDRLKKEGRKHLAATPTNISAQTAALTGTLPVAHTGVAPFFPLAVGNEWTYQVKDKSGATSVYTIRITDSLAQPDGSVTYRAQTELAGAGNVPFFWCTDGSSVWRKNRPTDAKSVWKADYVFAPESTTAAGDTSFEAMAAEKLSLPSGLFSDTIKLRRKDTRYTKECVFGRGVGLLQSICAETGVTETLISYKCAKPAPAAPISTASNP